MSHPFRFDVIIIGTGAAGLTAALSLPNTLRVAVLSKGALMTGSTPWAQGGIAAAIDQTHDSIEQHVHDTLVAGAGLCDERATAAILQQAPACIEWLIEQGVQFSQHNDQLHLTKEGGHSVRRVIHSQDATGRALAETLLAQCQARSNITLLDHCTALELLTNKERINGVQVLHNLQLINLSAANVVLACGGASSIYQHASTAPSNIGDGIAMAWRAGAQITNLEFTQFHPTCLYQTCGQRFLISEALRGEGGLLKRLDGSTFMTEYDHRAELAPRDIVARAIHHEMQTNDCPHLYLDISHQPQSLLDTHFPTISEQCRRANIDISRQPIPITPAAHYSCGGIAVDGDAATSLTGLYAIGECSCTGLHGANRLASNSLLECVVTAQQCARAISGKPLASPTLAPAVEPKDEDSPLELAALNDTLKNLMWDHVGIVRHHAGLTHALSEISNFKQQIDDAPLWLSPEWHHSRNLALLCELTIRSALQRSESRGAHFLQDHPKSHGEQGRPTVLRR